MLDIRRDNQPSSTVHNPSSLRRKRVVLFKQAEARMPKATKERKFRAVSKLPSATVINAGHAKVADPVVAASVKATRIATIKHPLKHEDPVVATASDAKTVSLAKPTSAVSASETTGTKGNKGSDEPTNSAPLSKGQRKRQAKRDQYMRKERMILSSLQVKHAEEQAKRIDGLDAIKQALLATVASNSQPRDGNDAQSKKAPPGATQASVASTATAATTAPATATNSSLLQSNRGRKLLLEKELTQMNLVLQHPSFQSDPFATMREHLQNTIHGASSVPSSSSSSSSTSRPSQGKGSGGGGTKSKSNATSGQRVSGSKGGSDKDAVVKRKRKKTKVRATRSKHR
jgi:Ribosome biogenesis protein SLX9